MIFGFVWVLGFFFVSPPPKSPSLTCLVPPVAPAMAQAPLPNPVSCPSTMPGACTPPWGHPSIPSLPSFAFSWAPSSSASSTLHRPSSAPLPHVPSETLQQPPGASRAKGWCSQWAQWGGLVRDGGGQEQGVAAAGASGLPPAPAPRL